MKTLLFTHISDIDGLNNIILAKESFDHVDYILCEPSEIDTSIYKNSSRFNKYSHIYITDLCPNTDTLNYINDNFKDKFKVIDHHKSTFDASKYAFVILRTDNEKGMCSGTSLFYEYLVNSKYLKPNITLDKFVELTRRYDTWEWKKYNDLEACDLMYLLYAVGIDDYLKRMEERIKQDTFCLNKEDISIIKKWKQKFDKKIKSAADSMTYLDVLRYKAGVVRVTHEYRNDIVEYVRDKNYDIDLLIIVLKDREAISYRSVKDIDVSEVARHYGGNGHKAAAGSPITKEEKKNIAKYFNKPKID